MQAQEEKGEEEGRPAPADGGGTTNVTTSETTTAVKGGKIITQRRQEEVEYHASSSNANGGAVAVAASTDGNGAAKVTWGGVQANGTTAAAASSAEARGQDVHAHVAINIAEDAGADGGEYGATAELDAETYAKYMTSAELQVVSDEAFFRLYPAYRVSDRSMGGKMGFNVVDAKEIHRWRWAPSRAEYTATRTPGGIRRPFRMTEQMQAERFKFLIDYIRGGDCSTGWFLNISLRAETRRMRMVVHALRANAKLAQTQETTLLKFLSLKGCRIGVEGAALLAEGLADNRTIGRLNLSGNELGEAGIQHIAAVLSHSRSIQALDVSLNRLGDAGAAVICDAILSNIHSAVSSLDLSTNEIGSRGGWYLSTLIREHTSLICLILVRNRLGSTPVALAKSGAASIFAEYPKAKHLHHFNVAYNNITEADFAELLEAQADVDWTTRVYPEEDDPISDPRPKPTRHLVLTGNMASIEQMIALAKGFEITPYTTASRAGKAPVFRPVGAYYNYEEMRQTGTRGYSMHGLFERDSGRDLNVNVNITAKYSFHAKAETTAAGTPLGMSVSTRSELEPLPPPAMGGSEEGGDEEVP